MEKFDMGKFLAEAGVNLDTEKREQIEYISIDLIVPDPDNFYELSGLADLAENISLLGLQQPIRVRPMPGDESQVIIISGHRRHAALKMLIEQDGRDDLRDVPCIVERGEENPKLTQLKLIYANASTRVLTSAEQARQAEQVEKLLYELKEDGMEFPGRMRDHVAQACKMSTGKLARLKVIQRKLIPQFLKLWEAGRLREAVAYTLAGQSQERQKRIFIVQTEDYKKPFCCTDGWVGNIARQMDDIEQTCKSLACPVCHTTSCDHMYTRLDHAAGLRQYEGMYCPGCCISCHKLADCKYSCEHAADAKSALRDKRRAEKREEKETQRKKEQPSKDLLAASYGRVAVLRKEQNVSPEDYVKVSLGYSYDLGVKRLGEIENGKAVSLQDRMPGGIWADEAKRLIATADLLGCSIDYLLGRTDVRETTQPEGAVPCACECMSTPEFIPGAWYPASVEPPVGVRLILIDSGGFVDDGLYQGSGDYSMDYGDTIALWTLMPEESDVSTSAPPAAAVPEKCVNVDTWHTGTPPKPGWYICRIAVDGVDAAQYHKHWFGGQRWQGLVDDIETITHWVPVLADDD